MRNIVITFILGLAVLVAPSGAQASHEEIVCPQPYGNGVVCGAKTHEPVDAALGDINPAILGGGFLVASGTVLYLSKRFQNKALAN